MAMIAITIIIQYMVTYYRTISFKSVEVRFDASFMIDYPL